MKALLLEDEPVLAQTLALACKKLGIQVEVRSTLSAARALLTQESMELLILDRQVPDGDGIELLREQRQQGFKGGVLMLTALGEIKDRVDGLRAGADDYLPKPFSWEEFSARIEAIVRRVQTTTIPVAESKTDALWAIDTKLLRILGKAGWRTLTPLEFRFAAYLIEHSDRIVPREELLREVWGFTLLPKTRTVDHFMGRIRKALESEDQSEHHFVTVRGAGYRFLERAEVN